MPAPGIDAGHVVSRLWRFARPNVRIGPPPSGVVRERDVEIPVRDGTILRADVYRPAAGAAARPVLLCAHPYGKDALPRPARRPGRYRTPLQLRMLPQSDPVRISAWTGWEAPDPGVWVPRGYTVVNCDLRGWGASDGTGELLSAQEGDDVHDVIEWIAAQSWCTGRVGMLGVSYLALTQWAAAATRPPHLAAICPWEGFTDAYRDFVRPGGVLEDGFVALWSTVLGRQHGSPVTLRADARAHPDFDAYWSARNRDIERIEVPALVCGSFSDHNLHSRGSFEGFRRIGSSQKWLYTHRGPKWATFYSDAAVAVQARFFDRFLRDVDDGQETEPPVRVEVREDRTAVVATFGATEWPPTGTRWEARYLGGAGRSSRVASTHATTVTFDLRRGRATFSHVVAEAVDVVGPMWLRLHLGLDGARDACIFAGVRKRRGGKVVGFEGSYGFDRALVAFGMLRVSHRAIDPDRSLPARPFHPCDRPNPVEDGEVVSLDIELGSSATRYRAGDTLELVVQGRWFFPTNPVTGQFPARYERSPRGTAALHLGGPYDSALHLPVGSALEVREDHGWW